MRSLPVAFDLCCGSPSHLPPPLPARCSDLLLPALWPALPGEERDTVLTRLGEAESREKLPAVKSLAAQLAAKLRALA